MVVETVTLASVSFVTGQIIIRCSCINSGTVSLSRDFCLQVDLWLLYSFGHTLRLADVYLSEGHISRQCPTVEVVCASESKQDVFSNIFFISE